MKVAGEKKELTDKNKSESIINLYKSKLFKLEAGSVYTSRSRL